MPYNDCSLKSQCQLDSVKLISCCALSLKDTISCWFSLLLLIWSYIYISGKTNKKKNFSILSWKCNILSCFYCKDDGEPKKDRRKRSQYPIAFLLRFPFRERYPKAILLRTHTASSNRTYQVLWKVPFVFFICAIFQQ